MHKALHENIDKLNIGDKTLIGFYLEGFSYKEISEIIGLEINLIVQGADRDLDVEKQMQIMENLIQRKVDAICLIPAGSKGIIPAIVKANKAGIPVLIIDNRIDNNSLKEAGELYTHTDKLRSRSETTTFLR